MHDDHTVQQQRSRVGLNTQTCKSRALSSHPLIPPSKHRSAGLEQEDGHLSDVGVDERLALVCDVRSEVAADDAVPRWHVLAVKLLLDVRGDLRPLGSSSRTPTADRTLTSRSMENFSIAWVAVSMASCCMSSGMSAFLMIALRSAAMAAFCEPTKQLTRNLRPQTTVAGARPASSSQRFLMLPHHAPGSAGGRAAVEKPPGVGFSTVGHAEVPGAAEPPQQDPRGPSAAQKRSHLGCAPLSTLTDGPSIDSARAACSNWRDHAALVIAILELIHTFPYELVDR
jgi:hypothetical protein